jgi:V8-like Glu-specific endopeptidase
MRLFFTLAVNTVFTLLFIVSAEAGKSKWSLPSNHTPVQGSVENLTASELQFYETHMGRNYNFNGIVALNNCSGALVRFKHQLATDQGLILTNGHCVSNPDGGFIRPGEHVHNRADKRTFRFLNPDGTLMSGTVSSSQLSYATMTKTDLAIYELDQTFAEIEAKFKVKPLTMQEFASNLGEPIQILSGYWRRGYECKIDGTVSTLREDAYAWIDSIRYSKVGCQTIPGTSGSPIISMNSGMIVGVNNTGNTDGLECTMDNPCEVDADGTIRAEKGRSYGQQIYWLYSCLNKTGKLDVKVPSCRLPGGAAVK